LFVKVTKCEPEEDACGGAAAVEEGGGDDSVDEVGAFVERLELTTSVLEELDDAEPTTVEEEVAGAIEPKSEEGTVMDSETLVLVVPLRDSEADATTTVELEVGDIKLHEARLRFTPLSIVWKARFATSA